MGLNAKQKQAVEYLDGPLLVLAGPGTGKTQLLSEKVAYILKNTDTNPENILCMTFTESGATNMRERLKRIVGKDGLKVNIGTYHAFGTEILAQYKNYSEDYDRKLDSAIDEVTQFKIVQTIQSSLPRTDILRGDNVKDIIEVISSAKSAGLSYDDLSKIAEQNIDDSKVLSEAISPLLLNIVPRAFKESYENAYRPIYEILKNYTDKSNEKRIVYIIAKDLKEAILEAEGEQKIKPLTKWKDAYFEKDDKGNYRLKDRVANKKLLSIANVMAKYDQFLRDNGLYDFDDMIQEAVRVLKTDEGFKMSLAERYQFIMLDEFQDTNPSQFMIIKLLTDYEKPMVMAVGDDDQAIYEFQGALSTNLTDFQAHYSAEVVALVENYRSTQEILDFSRKVIEQAPDRFADKELVAHKEAPTKTQIERHEFISSDQEYGFVADKIAKLIKSGVKQSDIAVISYKTKYFMPLLPYLKSHKEIKIAYEKRDDLFNDEKIHQILTISNFIYELANEKRTDTPILEILAYPSFNLPIFEVVKAISSAKQAKKSVFLALLDSDNVKIAEIMQFFSNLVAKSYDEPLEVFLSYLIGTTELNGFRSPLYEFYTHGDDYEAFLFYENLAALKGKLKRHFGEKLLKLSDLIEMVNEYREAEMPLSATSPYRDADDAVQILSAHKAKGLEFEYVFMISVDHMAWGKGKGNNNMLALPKNLAEIRHTGTTDGEKLRILYVALTRAKSHLIITNSLHDFNGKSPDRLEYLDEYEGEGGTLISPLIPAGKVTTHNELNNLAGAPEIAENALNNIENWLVPYIQNSPDMRALYLARMENFRMSASALTSFIDVVYAGPESFFKTYVLNAPREPETEALAYGDLIHKTFEAVTNKNLPDEKAVEFYLKELEKKELSIDILKDIREKGPADLLVALSNFGAVLRQGKAEVNLAVEKLVINGVPVTGKLDHIIIDDDKKTIELYDFKTGGYHKEKWNSHATLYKYRLQLGFYKLLLNASPTYSKYKVERAHILFVTPDKDGEVYDKVYEFNDEDEKELISILKSVYELVESLKFIDDTELMISADPNKGLKDIKKFIELVLAKASK